VGVELIAAPAHIRAEALELRRQGWTYLAIAAALDVCPQVVGRWTKVAGVTKPKTERPTYRRLKRDDPGYGPVCECGGKKSVGSLMCQQCRLDALKPAGNYTAELAECWPIHALPMPPFLWEPRVIMYDRSEPA